jgi:hypothetical protein
LAWLFYHKEDLVPFPLNIPGSTDFRLSSSFNMLSVAAQDFQHQPSYYMPVRPLATPLSLINTMAAHQVVALSSNPMPPSKTNNDATVAQALEIARESPDGASDPTISGILEAAISQIWTKVQAQPDCYIMTRDEFAVFNFFQHRFEGNKMAVAARRRYWDNARA